MDKVVRLRHAIRKGDWRMYFYDGELPVVDSTLTIPADRPEWIQRAWIMGFRMTVDGRIIADLAKHIRAETVPADEIEHNPVSEDFVHIDSPECLCLKEPVECCSDECCQPETEELALACCNVEGCCEGDTDCACADTTPVVETETAESGEDDTDEGTAAGGLPVEDDGVRSGESDRDGSLPEGGDDSRVGDEPADGGDGDESAD